MENIYGEISKMNKIINDIDEKVKQHKKSLIYLEKMMSENNIIYGNVIIKKLGKK